MINKLVFLFVFLMMLAGCQSRQTYRHFYLPGLATVKGEIKDRGSALRGVK